MRDENVIALLGGLGNQLFQVSFGQWLSQKSGHDVSYDVSFSRRGGLEVLEVPEIGSDVRDRVLWATRRWPTAEGRLSGAGRALRRLRGPRQIVSDYTALGPSSLSWDEPAWWFGYWQRLEYARPLIDRLANALGTRDLDESDGLVGVHVRRGDMLRTGGSVDEGWFRIALERLPMDLRDAQVTVWSDDPDWCRNHLDLGVPFVISPPDSSVEHLRGLARCRTLVMSRSSFSWWAAAVAASRGALVAVPTPWWPGNSDLDQEIVPSTWTPVAHEPTAARVPPAGAEVQPGSTLRSS